MAAVRLSKPPRLPAHAHYSLYRDWLLNNFYDHLCSYCLLQHESLEIEHVEPVQYAPNRKNDPSNLLLACRRCNGGKSDYHPLLGSRRTRTQDRTGFSVLDVRRDDFTDLYEITQDGRLQPKPGQHYERAIWNVLLLKLDIKFVADKRAECLRILHACEGLIEDEFFEGQVTLILKMPAYNVQIFETNLTELTNGQIDIVQFD